MIGFILNWKHIVSQHLHDKLQDGRTIRLLNVIDDFNLKAIGMEVDFSLPSERVIREPVKAQQNAYVERFNRKVRYG